MRLLMIFGPPAVGKMTVGREVARRSSFRLFHNHASIEALLEVFDYGTEPFLRLNEGFRRQVFTEAAASGTDLIFTYVWALDAPEDVAAVERYLQPYVDAGAEVAFVELVADLPTRLERNRTEQRLADKRSKRDVEWSDGNVRDLEAWVMTTDASRRTPADDVIARHRHLRLDNSRLTAEESAERILAWLDDSRHAVRTNV